MPKNGFVHFPVLILVVLVGLFGAGAIYFTQNRSVTDNPKSSNNTALKTESTVCTLPKVEIKERALNIGLPKDWSYEVQNETVAITKDKSNTTSVYYYSAKMAKDYSTKQFLNDFVDIFNQSLNKEGGNFSVGDINEKNNNASAGVVAKIKDKDLLGDIAVYKEDTLITLKAYWMPKDEFETGKTQLVEVANCITRNQVITDEIISATKAKENIPVDSSGHKLYTGRYFKLLLPKDFKVTGETDSGIDTTRSDNQAGFSYAYVTGAKGPYTPLTWVKKALPEFAKIYSLNLSIGRSVPSKVGGLKVEEFDFTGMLQGTISVKGKVTAGIYNTPDFGLGSSSSAFWAIQIAVPSVWASVSNSLQITQNSIEIIDIGATRKNTILPPNRPIDSVGGSSITSKQSYADSVSDKIGKNWSEATLGYEEVTSPYTGQHYDVPINSWNPSGSQGAGYYRQLPDGSSEKLSPL